MKARGNIIMSLIMVVSAFCFLIFSGVIHFKQPGMDDFKNAAVKYYDEATMVPGDQVKLRKAYGINARDTEDFIYYAPKSTMDASEIIIIRFPDEKGAENAAATIKSRTLKLRDQFRNYKPEQADLIDNSYLKVQGKYLIYISSEKSREARADIEQIIK